MNYNILIKFPTRQRPEKFFNTLDLYINSSSNLSKIGFVISLDIDDLSMNNDAVTKRFDRYKNDGVKLACLYDKNKTKVEAINSNMSKIKGWDIVLLASDDMIPVVKGYDDVIRQDMADHFADTDGVLWYNDGGQDRINTLCILGKKYFDRFGYIYHPDYTSLWCDNEFTDVSQILQRVYKSKRTIIEHAHPVYQKAMLDQLYRRNESFMQIDKKIYESRKQKNFDLYN